MVVHQGPGVYILLLGRLDVIVKETFWLRLLFGLATSASFLFGMAKLLWNYRTLELRGV